MRRTLQSMIKPHVVRDMTLTIKFGSIQVICNMHGSVTIGQLKLHLETVPELMMKNPHCKDTNADDSSFPAMIPIPAEIQRLIYSGRELQDSKTLDYYAIEESNFIFLVRYPSNYMPPLPMVGSSEEQKDPDMITTATETGATASLSPSDIPQQADQAAATESAMDISVAPRAVHELLGVEAAPAQPDFTELLSSAQSSEHLRRIHVQMIRDPAFSARIFESPTMKMLLEDPKSLLDKLLVSPEVLQLFQQYPGLREFINDPVKVKAGLERARRGY